MSLYRFWVGKEYANEIAEMLDVERTPGVQWDGAFYDKETTTLILEIEVFYFQLPEDGYFEIDEEYKLGMPMFYKLLQRMFRSRGGGEFRDPARKAPPTEPRYRLGSGGAG